MDWKRKTCVLGVLLLCTSVVVSYAGVKPVNSTDGVREVTKALPAKAMQLETGAAKHQGMNGTLQADLSGAALQAATPVRLTSAGGEGATTGSEGDTGTQSLEVSAPQIRLTDRWAKLGTEMQEPEPCTSTGGLREALQGGNDCAHATAITCPGTYTGTTLGYTNLYNEVCPYTPTGAFDVVYVYTPTANQLLTVDLCASGYDTKTYIYEDTCPDTGNPYACNDDACGGTYRSFLEDVPVFAGHDYYIVVDGYEAGANGAYSLTLSCVALTTGACCRPGDVCDDDVDYTACQGLGEIFHSGLTCAGVTCEEAPVNEFCGAAAVFGYDDTGGTVTLSDQLYCALATHQNINYRQFDGFWDVGLPIIEINFVGEMRLFDQAWGGGCEKNPVFDVRFYAEEGGNTPGTQVEAWILTATTTDEINWTITLPEPVMMSEGWFSLMGMTDMANECCAFAWLIEEVATTQDNRHFNQQEGFSIGEDDDDLSFCLIGDDSTGACCNDLTGICLDEQSPVDCQEEGDRFKKDTLCVDLDVECGLGACCAAAGSVDCDEGGDDCCMVTSNGECVASGGTWFPGEACAATPSSVLGYHCPAYNDDCEDADPPQAITTSNLEITFTGRNDGATTDCELLDGPVVWEAFTTDRCYDLVVDYCGTSPVFTGAVEGWLFADYECDCDLSGYTMDEMSTTARVGQCCDDAPPGYDENAALIFNVTPAGDYMFAVLNSLESSGAYTLNVTATPCALEGFDCNTNGVHDWDDTFVFETSLDCNSNGIPDECEDCNDNGIADECDIADCTGAAWCGDCNANTTLDVCELDCDENGTPDDCQLTANPSLDCNTNGYLDVCDSCGDWNGDFVTNLGDYKVFQSYFGGPGAAVPARGQCMLDKDADGDLDLYDFFGFQGCRDALATCPAGGVSEGEPMCGDDYVDGTNYGCYADAAPYNFSPLLTDGTVVCAEGGHYADTVNPGYYGADVDWYEFTLTGDQDIDLTVTTEFAYDLFLFDASQTGDACPADFNDIGFMTGYVDIPAGLEFGLTGCLPGRTYWLLIRTAFPDPFYRLDDLTPCGSLYTVSLNTTPCTAEVGACCSYAASPTCTDSVDSMDCYYTNGGNYMGDGTICAETDCPLTSCCRADTSCDDGVAPEDCAGLNEFFAEGLSCAERDCSAPPVGNSCPEGSVFGPGFGLDDGGSTAVSSYYADYDTEFRMFDNFFGVADPITGITVWGMITDSGTGLDCVPLETEFEVAFYGDNGGLPDTASGAIAGSPFTVTGVATESGWGFSGNPLLYQIDMALPDVVISAGWISVTGTSGANPNCNFAWLENDISPYDLDFAYATATAGYLDPALNGEFTDLSLCMQTGEGGVAQVDCAAGLFTCSGTPEGEPVCSADYQDLTNNGCSPSNTGSSDTLGAVTCGETICGTTGNFTTNGGVNVLARDRDWFEFTLDEKKTIEWTVQVQGASPYTAGVAIAIWDHNEGCTEDLTYYAYETNYDDCTPVTATATLPPGTYAVTVFGNSVLDSNGDPLPPAQSQPCGTEYQAALTCSDPDDGWIEAPGDLCTAPVAISGAGYWSGLFDTNGYNWEGDADCNDGGLYCSMPCSRDTTGTDVDGWYLYQAPCTGRVWFETCDGSLNGASDIKSIVAAWQGPAPTSPNPATDCAALTQYLAPTGAVDDTSEGCGGGNPGNVPFMPPTGPKAPGAYTGSSCGTRQAHLALDVVEGEYYYIQLMTEGEYGQLTLTVSECVEPCVPQACCFGGDAYCADISEDACLNRPSVWRDDAVGAMNGRQPMGDGTDCATTTCAPWTP